jgi:ankyrin repeat protein
MHYLGRVAMCLTLGTSSTALVEAQPTHHDAKYALFHAIRDGDKKVVARLLKQGADVNARDVAGVPALMQATLNADVGMMELLLTNGAQADAQAEGGATALLWGLHDPAKVRLLLDHGAKVSDQAVFTAVAIPGAEAVLRLLAEHGANFNIRRNGFTPLMAAVRSCDLSMVRFLIDKGADVRGKTANGFTALYGAASWPGNVEIVRLLLDQGADANARVEVHEPAHDVHTALASAASHGDPLILQALLSHGADCNAQEGDFGRTALLVAVSAGNAEAAKLLLARGADVNACDGLGNSPLQWVQRRGDTVIVDLLKQSGAREPPDGPPSKDLPWLRDKLDGDSVERAMAKALPLLQQSGLTFSQRRHCVSCHHQSLVAMAVGAAKASGLPTNEQIAAKELARVTAIMEKAQEKLVLGSGATDELAPAYVLAGMDALGQQPNGFTDALVQYLILRQHTNGSWKTPVQRPPQDASELTITALAIRGLGRFAPKGRAKEVAARIACARSWLLQARPHETEEVAFRLLGLRWSSADSKHVGEALETLILQQREDGGWAQLPTLPSDAYATGLALFAAGEGGRMAVRHPAYRRGVEYLLRTQLADGSWFVQTRSFPLQPFVGTGFPHGRSQFSSLSATCWASMALALSRANHAP